MFFFWFFIGGQEFFWSNVITVEPPISELKFALSGNPPPEVTWGLKKNETNRSTKRISRLGEQWYIHDYSLNYTKEICGRMLYFKADVQDREPLTWGRKYDVNCKWFYDQFDTAWRFTEFWYLIDWHCIVLLNISLLRLLFFKAFLEISPWLFIRALLKTRISFCVLGKLFLRSYLSWVIESSDLLGPMKDLVLVSSTFCRCFLWFSTYFNV